MARKRETEPTCELGRQLEKDRKTRDLTKEAWAAVLDTTKPTYNKWLGGSEPSVANMYAIAHVLDVPPCDVLGWIATDAPAVTIRAMGRLLNSRPMPVAAAA